VSVVGVLGVGFILRRVATQRRTGRGL
jgi:hypothetical protein